MAVYMFGDHSIPTRTPRILWTVKQKKIEHAAIGGHMIVVPNNKELIGKWPHDKYEADFYFIKDTCDSFIARGYSPVWINFIVSEVRPWSRYLINYSEQLKISNSPISYDKNYEELHKKIREKDWEIYQLLESTSWKITKPLRLVGQIIKKVRDSNKVVE
jgi:hypothetical protein